MDVLMQREGKTMPAMTGHGYPWAAATGDAHEINEEQLRLAGGMGECTWGDWACR
ncbi:hypothetical protein [Oryza sativa Japonica Group]|uniref:Uncharacterized protein n=1 Tax=Oryza sativa subsp. japonica TaxID=39947 RepID=Q5ZBD2_ORYSJ|nr:hypothetical protein [Oryza sativa Japonica Group]